MVERTRAGDPSPGDVRPPLRPLQRPPGERYLRAPDTPGEPTRPAVGRAAVLGSLAAIAVAVVWGLLLAVLDLGLGLIAVAVVGGWVIGTAVTWGAWRTPEHPRATAVQALAALLGAASWLAGWFVAYLISLAILPASSVTFGERLEQQPFLAWLTPQVFIVEAVELGLLAVIAWRSAR